jgi:hypothetical protein
MRTISKFALAAALAAACAIGGSAEAAKGKAQPKAPAPAAKSGGAYESSDPRGPEAGPLSALAPANLKKARPKAPFDLTGTWFVDLAHGGFLFAPTHPKLLPDAQKEFDAAQAATKAGKAYKDWIGQCYPAGLPVIMTRVWPIAMIQKPTAIYMVSGFENAFRAIYLDGRQHSDPDVVVRSWNGESIGHWEGDTLVVDSRYFISDKHTIDEIPVSDDLHIVERITLSKDGQSLHIRYTMTDPKNWEGEWISDKSWKRADDQDITEVECTPDLDQHLVSTQSVLNVR